MSDIGYASFDPVAFLGKMQEDQKKREYEQKARYLPRKEEKVENRRRLEKAAMKICGMIDTAAEKAPEDIKTHEIAELAAALNYLSMAMHSADNYAEHQPPGDGWLMGT